MGHLASIDWVPDTPLSPTNGGDSSDGSASSGHQAPRRSPRNGNGNIGVTFGWFTGDGLCRRTRRRRSPTRGPVAWLSEWVTHDFTHCRHGGPSLSPPSVPGLGGSRAPRIGHRTDAAQRHSLRQRITKLDRGRRAAAHHLNRCRTRRWYPARERFNAAQSRLPRGRRTQVARAGLSALKGSRAPAPRPHKDSGDFTSYRTSGPRCHRHSFGSRLGAHLADIRS